MQGGLTVASLTNLLNKVVEGSAIPFYLSEPVPETNSKAVRTVVGQNFNREVIDNDKDVLVEFHAEWCEACKHLAPVYLNLATKLRANSNLVLAEMDGVKNEVAGLKLSYFPTIMLYPKGQKDQPILFKGRATSKTLLNFVRSHMKNAWVNDEGHADL